MSKVSGRESSLFSSFWMAGFESSCHRNGKGIRLDMVAATQHDRYVAEDYARLAETGIRTVREGMRWPWTERNGRRDFTLLMPVVEAAWKFGIQTIWDICHFGWPDDVDVFGPEFPSRFADACNDAARFIRSTGEHVGWFVPINEISFIAWAAGQVGWFFPYAKGVGNELKRQLVRAAVAGIDALRAELPRARIIHIDPVLHIIPPKDRPELQQEAAAYREAQFEAWDMLAGRLAPELGGGPEYLDIVAINYYHSNQFEYQGERLFWEEPKDERRVPFHRLICEVHKRYQRPVFIGETSHFGTGRGEWILDIASEALQALRLGTPLEGICIYPIIDRPDWEDLNDWHNSGLWDLVPGLQGNLERVINVGYRDALFAAQQMLSQARQSGTRSMTAPGPISAR
jgi:hypothetical protein